MKRKMILYICIIQTIIIISGILLVSLSKFPSEKYELVDANEFLGSYSEENNFIPDEGYIPDARTAKVVGGQIIDGLTGKKFWGATTVEYDAENRLWIIYKNYFPSGGAFVVIEQDTGKIIKALLNK